MVRTRRRARRHPLGRDVGRLPRHRRRVHRRHPRPRPRRRVVRRAASARPAPARTHRRATGRCRARTTGGRPRRSWRRTSGSATERSTWGCSKRPDVCRHRRHLGARDRRPSNWPAWPACSRHRSQRAISRAVISAVVPEAHDDAVDSFGRRFGVALSGGGFRASLFHLGVLAAFAEHDLLRPLEVLSCVSGGSIVGTAYYSAVATLLGEKVDADITRDDLVDGDASLHRRDAGDGHDEEHQDAGVLLTLGDRARVVASTVVTDPTGRDAVRALRVPAAPAGRRVRHARWSQDPSPGNEGVPSQGPQLAALGEGADAAHQRHVARHRATVALHRVLPRRAGRRPDRRRLRPRPDRPARTDLAGSRRERRRCRARQRR